MVTKSVFVSLFSFLPAWIGDSVHHSDTWSHHYMTAFSSEDAFAELWYTVSIPFSVRPYSGSC